jgi:autophagy-related protein 13
MHQHPRAPPITAFPASSERTNPERTNNERDRDRDRDRDRYTPPAENFSHQPQDRAGGSDDSGSTTSNPAAEVTRLNQVIQVRFTKHGTNKAQLTVSLLELSHQSGSDNPSIEI